MAQLKTIEILELFCFWGIQSFPLSLFFNEMFCFVFFPCKTSSPHLLLFTGVFQLSLLEPCLENYNEEIN